MSPALSTARHTHGGAHAPGASGQRPQPPTDGSTHGRFPLTRRFGIVALLAIGGIAVLSVWLLGGFVTQRMLLQEGVLTRDFVQSLVAVEQPLQRYFAEPAAGAPERVEESFEHFARMPDMLRTNVYAADRTVLWSSERELIGRRFGPNHDLDMALAGAVIVDKKTDLERRQGKAEYVALHQPAELFIEIYVPVIEPGTGRVLGAIEFYKNPRALMRSLHELRLYSALGAGVFAVLLFASLFGLVRRADRMLHEQQARIVGNETFAVVGEMSSVVAHGIRNPLAAIRSSAELIVDGARGPQQAATAEAAQDIVEQADRLGAWVRELLSYTRSGEGRPQALALPPLVRSCLHELARETERRQVRVRAELPEALPPVQGDSLVVGQVLRSVLANAMEAVPDGGCVTVSARADASAGRLLLTVHDTGPGLSAEGRARVGKPFFTTKAQGMGVGLALARRVLERGGGFLDIGSAPGAGTTVTIGLCQAHPTPNVGSEPWDTRS